MPPEENNNQANNGDVVANETPPARAANETPPIGEGVTLSGDQYNALLDRIYELESEAANRSRDRSTYDVDDLADEARRQPVNQRRAANDTDENVEEMNQEQFASYVVGEVNKVVGRVVNEVETLKVLREIDKCEAKYEDFWEYEQEVQRIASENPQMSIERAYRLAKAESGEKGDKGTKSKTANQPSTTEKLLRLPPRSMPGEKPGVAPGSTSEGDVKTLKGAAERAWDEAVGKGKNEI